MKIKWWLVPVLAGIVVAIYFAITSLELSVFWVLMGGQLAIGLSIVMATSFADPEEAEAEVVEVEDEDSTR